MPVQWLKVIKTKLIITSVSKNIKLIGLYVCSISTFGNPLTLSTNGKYILPYDLEIPGLHQTKVGQNKYPRIPLSV